MPLNFPEREPRSQSFENPAVSLSDPTAWAAMFGAWQSAAGPTVNAKTALGVPALMCGVNFLSSLIASLPLQEFKKTDAGREQVKTGMIAGMLGGTVNDDYLTSFNWRKAAMVSTFLTGAGRTFVEKDRAGRPVNLWPLETKRTKKYRKNGRTLYDYRRAPGDTVTYEAHEVLDIHFMPDIDGVGAIDPINALKDTIGLAIALERYASKFFLNGGVPPLALHTPLGSPGANKRAGTDTAAAVRDAHESGRNVLVLPSGTELKPVGFNPADGQLIEARKFVILDFARFLNLPPAFLQDLSSGTFNNTEQQDLHLVKHSATHWCEQWEQEMQAKFYGPRSTAKYVEHNLDGVLRGDFKSRMEGWVRGVQGAIITPNEARRGENRPDLPGGDRLYVQGATIPLEDAGKVPPIKAPTPTPDPFADPADPIADPADPADPTTGAA